MYHSLFRHLTRMNRIDSNFLRRMEIKANSTSMDITNKKI